MKKTIFPALLLLSGLTGCKPANDGAVTFNDLPDERRVEVLVDGRHFTDFIYPADMEKQVLWPIRTASGIDITRGYPLAPRPYERVDHPHHSGMWLNFGNVNGLDFWNNYHTVAPERKHLYGTIRFGAIVEKEPENGKLVVTARWVNSGDTVLLNERTTYLFGGDRTTRTIERTTELTARTEVVFTEDKEGLFGLRLDRAFEEPSANPVETTGATGTSAGERTLNNDGVNGMYRNAPGDTAAAVWGKRSPWVTVRGEKGGVAITVAIVDHPENPGYPAWSHARGYGLFAANNLAGSAVEPGAEPISIILQPGETVVFRHRVIIAEGEIDERVMADEINIFSQCVEY